MRSGTAKCFAVPEHRIRSIMQVEIANCRRDHEKGAVRPVQIMARTWSDLRARYDFGADPCDPRDERINRGRPGSRTIWRPVDRLPDETQDYVAIIAPMISGKQ